MTCRSSAVNSVSTSVAIATNPDLNETQVQSLFHSIRRSTEAGQHPAPLPSEFDEHVESLRFRIRNDEALSDSARTRYLARLANTDADPYPDGKTWFAVQHLPAAAGAAQTRLASIYDRASIDMKVDPGKIRMMMQEWRDAPLGAYEECAAPDPQFQYHKFTGVPEDDDTQRALRKLGYEHFLAQPYPVFVYGTLRQGQGNNHLLDDAYTNISTGRVYGCSVYGGQWGFPYACESPNPEALTVGEVVWLRDDHTGDTARYLMDALEGFHSDRPSGSHYERIRTTATITTRQGPESIPVWMYVARGSSQARLIDETPIPHGDWVAARREHLTDRGF